MKVKEVEERFLNGERIVKLFYTRKVSHEIGGKRITEKQFDYIKEKYDTKFIPEYGMVTKHYYSIKK